MGAINMAIELKRDIYEELLQWKRNNTGLVLETVLFPEFLDALGK